MFSLSSFCSFIGFFIAAVASALKSLPAAIINSAEPS
tara:strand:+ start:467 stop:577 length:111 start_codon:yes stop_codon:yes gene_type:complete